MTAGIISDAILIATTVIIAVYVYLDGRNHGDWP